MALLNEKKLAAKAAVDYVQNGMTLGLGSGTTVAFFIQNLGERVRQGLSIKGIPTSEKTRELAEEAQIPLISFSDTTKIDLTIDGADEIDHNLSMIKGGGGALLREKIVAFASTEVAIMVDSSKVVDQLGKFPLPVEVNTFGWQVVARKISEMQGHPVLRTDGKNTFITDNGNYILDCAFESIADPFALEDEIQKIPGTVICGLFNNLATRAFIASDSQVLVKEVTI